MEIDQKKTAKLKKKKTDSPWVTTEPGQDIRLTFGTLNCNNLQLWKLFSFLDDVIISLYRVRASTDRLLELIKFIR